MEQRTLATVNWLLDSSEPAIRLMTRRDVLGEEDSRDDGVVLAGAKVAALLSGQHADGSFGVHPYRKWTGAHWRLISLVELAIPPLEPRAVAATGQVLAYLAQGRRHVVVTGGLARRCASVEGNALAACCRLGLAADPRVRSLAEALITWQWPDGGWNCDGAATGRRSSFHESLAPAWGLHGPGDPAHRVAGAEIGDAHLTATWTKGPANGEGAAHDGAW